MRTSNPALRDTTFEYADFGPYVDAEDRMSIQGTVNRTAILLLCVLVTAVFTWNKVFSGAENLKLWIYGSAVVGFIFGLVTIFKPTWAPVTAPIFALLEGLFLGGLSACFEILYPGIVFSAVALTFGTCFALLIAYKTRLIQATENFTLGVVAATGGICLVYGISMILRLFGSKVPYIHDSGMIGVGFSLVVVVIAALNFVLDFDFIEKGAESGAPKHMEWYGAFGLMVTLIWLYLELLWLLSKIRNFGR
jgi:uncharacterized YccA/Bax inhibitor family protein